MLQRGLSTSDGLDLFAKLIKICLGIEYPPLNSYQLAKDAIAIKLSEGESLGPWHGGAGDHIWIVENGRLRSVLEFRSGRGKYIGVGIHQERCVLGFWEAVAESCNISYICSSKSAVLKGIPVGSILKVLDGQGKKQIRTGPGIATTPYIAYVLAQFLQARHGLISMREETSRKLIGEIMSEVRKDLEMLGESKKEVLVIDEVNGNIGKTDYFPIDQHGMVDQLLGAERRDLSSYRLSRPLGGSSLYIKGVIIEKWHSLADTILSGEANVRVHGYQCKVAEQAIEEENKENHLGDGSPKEISEAILGRDFSERMREISGLIGQYKDSYNTALFADITNAITKWYGLPFRRRKTLDQLGDILNAYQRSGALGASTNEDINGKDTNSKLSARIIQRILEANGINTTPYTADLTAPDSIEYPFIFWNSCGFPQIAWARRGSKYLISRTHLGSNDNQNITSSLLEEKLEGDEYKAHLILEIARPQPAEVSEEKTSVLSWFLPALMKYRKEMILVLAASFIAQIFTVLSPLIIQRIVDTVIGQGNISALNVLGFFLFGFAILEGLLSVLRTYTFSRAINSIDLTLGMRVITKLLRLPFAYFSSRSVGETASRLNELEHIRSFLTGSALSVLLDSLFVVIYLSIMFSYSAKLTIGTLALAPLIAIITFSVAPIIRGLIREEAIENAKVQSHFIESLGSIETVKTQRLEQAVTRKWRELYSGEVRIGFKKSVLAVTGSNVSEFIEQMCSLFAIWLGAYLVLGGEMTIGELFAFRILSGYVTGPIVRLTSIWQNIQEAMLSFNRLEDIICRPDEAEKDHLLPPIPENIRSVSFKDVSFRYQEESDANILSHISLEIKPGKFTSIVGRSGSGKSTLLKLVVRLHDPNAGAVLVDDKDVRRYSISSLRSRIGYVPQESLLLQGSIEDNMMYSSPDATQKEIQWALETAVCDFVSGLPYGINTDVGERGILLSGGQRQRLSIARALLSKPPIVLLDEATSALDLTTERRLLSNMRREMPQATIISISHRISSVRLYSDHIVVIDSGKVIEQGSHNELIAINSYYASLLASGEQED